MARRREARLLASPRGPIEIAVREHARQKRLRLHVRSGEVLLTVPPRTTRPAIDAFLAEQRHWIAATVDRQLAGERLGLRRRGVVWRLGEPVAVVPGCGGRTELRGSELHVPRQDAEAAIERWYRAETRRLAEAAVAVESGALGVTVERVRVGDQRSRWGSASSRGTISLSWRLLLAPAEVFDYVLVHELCHLRELNHSPRFWSLVASARPGYREQKRWLARHGAELRAWQPSSAVGL
jgi:predicted metal-dependent hydrolase